MKIVFTLTSEIQKYHFIQKLNFIPGPNTFDQTVLNSVNMLFLQFAILWSGKYIPKIGKKW